MLIVGKDFWGDMVANSKKCRNFAPLFSETFINQLIFNDL